MDKSTRTRRLTAAGAVAVVTTAGLAVVALAPADAATNLYSNGRQVGIGRSVDTLDGDAGGIKINDGTMNGPTKATPYPSPTVFVTDLVGTVTKVVVKINGFDHQAPRDVDLMLAAPSGQGEAILMSDVGGATPVKDVDLVFDDASANRLTFDDKVASGTYHPSNDLAGDVFPAPASQTTLPGADLGALNGVKPNGYWYLYVVDDLAQYTGQIDSWSITVWTSGSEYPSTTEVSGVPGTVTDVDVALTIDHNRFGDIDVLLVGPGGQQVTLVSDAGGTSGIGSGSPVVLDDEAAGGVPDPVLPGRFRPTDLDDPVNGDPFVPPAPAPTGNTQLSVFDGTNPNGTWRLFVVDDQRSYGGFLRWTLRITTTDPVTPTPTPTTPTGAPDTQSPQVESVLTKGKAVRRGADVVAIVDEALRPGSVKPATVYLLRKGSQRHVRATVTWLPGTLRVVVNPRKKLAPGTTYVAVVTTAVTDAAGNRLDQDRSKAGNQPKRWRFDTR